MFECGTLALYLAGRYLNAADSEFVQFITADVAHYITQDIANSVLIFPPVTSYHRLLIHKTVEEDFKYLCSFSIGEGEERRTVVCQEEQILRSIRMEQSVDDDGKSFGTRARGRGRRLAGLQHSPSHTPPVGGRGCDHDSRLVPVKMDARSSGHSSKNPSAPEERVKIRSKPRRPDVQIYVPKGRRQHTEPSSHSQPAPLPESSNTRPPQSRPSQDKRTSASLSMNISHNKRMHHTEKGVKPNGQIEPKLSKDPEDLKTMRKSCTSQLPIKEESKGEVKPGNTENQKIKDISEIEKVSYRNNKEEGGPTIPALVGCVSDTDISKQRLEKNNQDGVNHNRQCDNYFQIDSEVLSDFDSQSVNMTELFTDRLEKRSPKRHIGSDENDKPVVEEPSETSEINNPISHVTTTSKSEYVEQEVPKFECSNDITDMEPFTGDLGHLEIDSNIQNLVKEKSIETDHYGDNSEMCSSCDTAPLCRGAEEILLSDQLNENDSPTSLVQLTGFESNTTPQLIESNNLGDPSDLAANLCIHLGESVPVTPQVKKGEESDTSLLNQSIKDITKDECNLNVIVEKDNSAKVISSKKEKDKLKMEPCEEGTRDCDSLNKYPEQIKNELIYPSDKIESSCELPQKTDQYRETQNRECTLSKEEEEKVAMESEEDTWDALFDDDGEALDPSMLDELTVAVGKVHVQKTQFDYYNYQPKEPDLDDITYGHLVEIYDFPADLITRDILAAFRQFHDRGFDIKWVDDTHCIGVFSSSIAADQAKTMNNIMFKVRPISQATKATKMKVKRCAEFLEPYKPRPETSASVARSLVANALGLKTRVPKEKREEERKKLREAREKKKKEKKQKDDAWEGMMGKCAMDEV